MYSLRVWEVRRVKWISRVVFLEQALRALVS